MGIEAPDHIEKQGQFGTITPPTKYARRARKPFGNRFVFLHAGATGCLVPGSLRGEVIGIELAQNALRLFANQLVELNAEFWLR